MTDRRDREQDRHMREVDRLVQDEDNKRRVETERRGEELREAWRQRHPQEEREQGRPKKGKSS